MSPATFRTRYQFNSPTVATNTDTSFEVGRVVTMLDLETGLGWQNFTGNLRFSMGYMFSAWYNTVRVNEFINAVQTNNFVDPSDNFNGPDHVRRADVEDRAAVVGMRRLGQVRSAVSIARYLVLLVLTGVEADDGVGQQVVEIPVALGAAFEAVAAAVVGHGGWR